MLRTLNQCQSLIRVRRLTKRLIYFHHRRCRCNLKIYISFQLRNAYNDAVSPRTAALSSRLDVVVPTINLPPFVDRNDPVFQLVCTRPWTHSLYVRNKSPSDLNWVSRRDAEATTYVCKARPRRRQGTICAQHLHSTFDTRKVSLESQETHCQGDEGTFSSVACSRASRDVVVLGH